MLSFRVFNRVLVALTLRSSASVEAYASGGVWSGISTPTKVNIYTTPVGSVTRVVGMTIEENGIVSMPKQSLFLAYNSATDSDVTGDGTTFTIQFDTEFFDQNSEFASNTFTAKKAGKYIFSGTITLGDIVLAAVCNLYLSTTNRTYTLWDGQIGYLRNGSNVLTFNYVSPVVDLGEGHTAHLEIIVDSVGGTKIVDVIGQAASSLTSFSCARVS